jgi:hypothetical protein
LRATRAAGGLPTAQGHQRSAARDAMGVCVCVRVCARARSGRTGRTEVWVKRGGKGGVFHRIEKRKGGECAPVASPLRARAEGGCRVVRRRFRRAPCGGVTTAAAAPRR